MEERFRKWLALEEEARRFRSQGDSAQSIYDHGITQMYVPAALMEGSKVLAEELWAKAHRKEAEARELREAMLEDGV